MTAAPPINDNMVESGSANEAEMRAVSDGSPGGQAQMPLPSVRDVFQGGLFVLATLAALYAARQIVLPIVLAATLKVLLQPALRTLQRFRVPGALGALLLIGLLFCTLIAFGTALSGPANSWAEKLPQGVPRLQEHLSFLRAPIEAAQQFLQRAEDWFSGGQPSGGSSKGSSIGSSLLGSVFAGTRDFAGELFQTVLVLFFLLVAGDTFLRRLVEVLARFGDKRQAIEISQQIEEDISAYLITISVMNAAVGLATGLVMWLCGLGDPVFWGAVAFMLNYIPILGPMVGIVTFALVGLLTADSLWRALLPAGLYLAIHIVEGETVTPMLLARRFTLNPVLVVIAIIFWHWMWGVPGAILAVPMLAITKIVCDRISTLAAFGHVLEG
jgi:predicted PurR-regulated permease PerM